MADPFVLTVGDIDRYIPLRWMMLETEPHAFGSHPDSDGALDARVLRSRFESGHSLIVGVASATGELIATAGLFREPNPKALHRAHVVAVYVHPAHRGMGLGRAVVSAAIDRAREWPETERVCISVSEEADAARALYESLGFVAWGREPACMKLGDRLYDEIHMQMVLR